MSDLLICHLAGGPDDTPCRPLYEYARKLAAAQSALPRSPGRARVEGVFLSYDNVDWSGGEESLHRQIRRRAGSAEVVLFLHMVLPFVGGAVAPEFLDHYPAMVFPHQLEMLPEIGQVQSLRYLERAEHVVVTSSDEIAACLRLARRFGATAPPTDRFTVVDQPASFRPPQPVPLDPASDDVVVFGMFRWGKGLHDTIELARLLAADPAPGPWIDVIGHLGSRPDSLSLLADLLAATWGLPRDGEHGLQRLDVLAARQLVEVLEGRRTLQSLRPAAACLRPLAHLLAGREARAWETVRPRLRRLPIRVHLSVPEAEASRLLARAAYAYLPAEGGELREREECVGLTAHSSSAPTVAAHGNVLLAHLGKRSPANFRGAMVAVGSPAEAHAAIRRLSSHPRERRDAAARALLWAERVSWASVARATVRAGQDAVALHTSHRRARSLAATTDVGA